MSRVLILLTFLCLVSCSTTVQESKTGEKIGGYNIHIIKFDNCEYIRFSGIERGYLAHKGNCKYCEERRVK